jgi:hypothetical protein
MTLAGVWQESSGSMTLYIDGRDPSYNFKTVMLGSVVSQGTIRKTSGGEYLAVGQGIYGPVKMKFWLAQPNVLQGQNQVQIDGGILDSVFGAFMPQLGALQPVVTFVRQQPQLILNVPEEGEEEETPAPPKSKDKKPPHKTGERAEPAVRKEPEASSVQESDADPMEELKNLVGMAEVKTQVEQLNAWAWRQQELKEHQVTAKSPSLHMCFSGGPGTGKTTVARIIGRLLRKYGLLKHGRLQEVGRSDLVAEFLGQTAPKTEKLIESAIGGVLFIDEAYALSEPGAGGGARDYGAEALAVLIAGMENHRHELCVIVAGYPAEMERFIDANAGLASRISRHIRFPDFTDQELQDVFESMAVAEGLKLDPKILIAFQPYIRRAKAAVNARQWGNARSVRNILERGIENQSMRLKKTGKKPKREQLLRLMEPDFAFFDE